MKIQDYHLSCMLDGDPGNVFCEMLDLTNTVPFASVEDFLKRSQSLDSKEKELGDLYAAFIDQKEWHEYMTREGFDFVHGESPIVWKGCVFLLKDVVKDEVKKIIYSFLSSAESIYPCLFWALEDKVYMKKNDLIF